PTSSAAGTNRWYQVPAQAASGAQHLAIVRARSQLPAVGASCWAWWVCDGVGLPGTPSGFTGGGPRSGAFGALGALGGWGALGGCPAACGASFCCGASFLLDGFVTSGSFCCATGPCSASVCCFGASTRPAPVASAQSVARSPMRRSGARSVHATAWTTQ